MFPPGEASKYGSATLILYSITVLFSLGHVDYHVHSLLDVILAVVVIIRKLFRSTVSFKG